MTKPRIWPNPDYDSILWELIFDLDYDIYLFGHLQVTGGTSAAGYAHQIRSTWYHLPSFWLADSLCNVFSAPFGISAPIGLVWKFSVGMHGVTYLVVIHLVFTFLYFNVVFSCLSSSWHGLVIHFARELLAPSWCCACFVSRFLYTCFVVPAREGSAALHVVWMFLLLPILSENGFSLLEIDFVCLTSDSLTTDQYFVETFTCCLFTIWRLILLKIYMQALDLWYWMPI